MIKWFKRNQVASSEPATQQSPLPIENKEPVSGIEPVEGLTGDVTSVEEVASLAEPAPALKESFFSRFKKSLTKTRNQLGDGIGRLLLGKKEINPQLLEELETLLVSADLGMATTDRVLQQLTQGLARKQLTDGDAVYQALKNQLLEILGPSSALQFTTPNEAPFVLLMVGINGAGKTTTIGKLAKQLQQEGKKVMLAAGDTFRAAAVEQLQVWGERNNIPVIAQHTGADSASVIFDALQAAKARKIDVLIADTAGRLHTQHHLMDELKKVKRVLQKLDGQAPHETMLVLDASIGQNALVQARQFHEAIEINGITMTKLDGTAKGGILFAIANELHIPFRYLGVGEGIENLMPFDAAQFVDALFHDDRI